MDTTSFDSSQIDPNALSGLAAFFIAYALIAGIVAIGMYVLMGITHHKIYKKAGIKYPWLAWIPIANSVPFFWTIKKSALNMLWPIVPIILVIISAATQSTGLIITSGILYLVLIGLAIWWYTRFLKAFNISPHWLWCMFGLIIPLINFFVGIGFVVLICIIAFNSNVKYNPNFDGKGPDDSGVTL